MSLRDVERAMVVFKFFIEKMSLFKDLIAAKAKDEAEEFHCLCTVTVSLSVTIFNSLSLFLLSQDDKTPNFRMPLHGH